MQVTWRALSVQQDTILTYKQLPGETAAPMAMQHIAQLKVCCWREARCRFTCWTTNTQPNTQYMVMLALTLTLAWRCLPGGALLVPPTALVLMADAGGGSDREGLLGGSRSSPPMSSSAVLRGVPGAGALLAGWVVPRA